MVQAHEWTPKINLSSFWKFTENQLLKTEIFPIFQQKVRTLTFDELREKIDQFINWYNNERFIKKFNLKKVKAIVPGGETGQLSIFNGLEAAEKIAEGKESVVLIHDGVRPLINSKVIRDNIECVKKNGSAITTAPAKETIVLVNGSQEVSEVVDRTRSFTAKAPQSFNLSDILKVERDAISKGITDAIDSSTLMGMYNKTLHIVEGPYENIKITTPDDFYMFKALCDAREIGQIYGV